MKTILMILGALLAVLALYVATRPNQFHIERSTTIDAAPERIFPYVNDLRRMSTWSPWDKIDPQMERVYDGPDAGVGASYRWKGNKDIGEGSMKITGVTPNRQVVIALEFLVPFRASNVATFSLTPVGSSTRVTWAMDGPNTIVSKLMGLVMSMDTMVGDQFAKGLATLKDMVEREGK